MDRWVLPMLVVVVEPVTIGGFSVETMRDSVVVCNVYVFVKKEVINCEARILILMYSSIVL
jgi:hypothetical protein